LNSEEISMRSGRRKYIVFIKKIKTCVEEIEGNYYKKHEKKQRNHGENGVFIENL